MRRAVALMSFTPVRCRKTRLPPSKRSVGMFTGLALLWNPTVTLSPTAGKPRLPAVSYTHLDVYKRQKRTSSPVGLPFANQAMASATPVP